MATTIIPPELLHHRLTRSAEWAGVDPSELAELLGVHENTIHNYLAGRTRPRGRSALRDWALRTGVPLAWLEHGDDSPDTDPAGIAVTDGYHASSAGSGRRDRFRPRSRQPLGGGLRSAA